MAKDLEKGFAALYLILLVLGFFVAITASAFILLSLQQRIARNAQHSSQAYFTAQAGLEDAFLRLRKGTSWTNPIAFAVGAGTTSTNIAETNPGINMVTAQGNNLSRIRKIQALFERTGTTPAFFYGAHIGEGGLQMDNLSKVIGNVFSNGNIVVTSGKAEITETATVAGVGGSMSRVTSKHAFADICTGADIKQELHANDAGNCTYGSFIPLGTPPSSVPLPISTQEIQQWKDDALAGGVLQGDYGLDGSETATLGPKKIAGNLEIEGSAVLTLSGTLWVAGNVEVENSARVKLASAFGAMSGVIIADGTITLQNNSISEGSGNPDSYLIYLATSSSNPALTIQNNAIADILYTSQGWLEVQNNAQLVEVTGYGVHLKNNVVIQYETGLQDARFTAGPGAAWEIFSWQEVE